MESILQFIGDNRNLFYIIILAIFIGVEVINKVPSLLHTPLMSGANALSGVVMIGAMVVLGYAESMPDKLFGFLALILGTFNVMGGFVVTDRMLGMFKKKPKED